MSYWTNYKRKKSTQIASPSCAPTSIPGIPTEETLTTVAVTCTIMALTALRDIGAEHN
jgi:hypothetical protein